MVKASDIRSLFGRVTQKERLFRHTEDEINAPIKGAQAEALKFRPSLCEPCNNARTQPHDRAWETLSQYLRKELKDIKSGLSVQVKEAFGSEKVEHLLGVHFYFLKLLGCYAVEYNVPLPLNAFAVAILSGVPHPHLYISLVAMPSAVERPEVVVGDLQALQANGKLVGATWHYIVGTIGVAIAYSERGRPSSGKAWHPDDKLAAFTLA